MTEYEEENAMMDVLADIFIDMYHEEVKQRRISRQVGSEEKTTPLPASPPPCTRP